MKHAQKFPAVILSALLMPEILDTRVAGGEWPCAVQASFLCAEFFEQGDVLENPVRAGLTTGLGEYAFAGSGVYDLEALKTAWETWT